ncbi:alpha/beta fold hydrolase [Streptomyces sp. NBC_00285]|uniref:alpha/beta fold hydrolase n=1 Tax=Streptomyces sp. NBC_00285 TaxID=2975700 RepID=UPI002E2CD458|nr:alpha/beta fold hydrolase [Streptomyces sp. NBC_00285]
MRRAAIVFVHGLFSSSATWHDLQEQLSGCPGAVQEFDLLFFGYATRRTSMNPLRKMPNLDTIAESLRGYLDDLPPSYERLVFVTHSQGGLVVQRFLWRMLIEGRGRDLARIRRIVMFACPNNGSELFLLLRRSLMAVLRNKQERELRPLQASVQDAQRRVMTGIVNAGYMSSDRCPIPFMLYAGESDNVVSPTSAVSVFPEATVLPGDHFSVIKPGPDGRLVRALLGNLDKALREPVPKELVLSAPAFAQWEAQGKDFLMEHLRFGPVDVVTGSSTTQFFLHGGPLEQLSGIDIVVSSENTYLQMSQFFKPTVSASLRRAAAIKGAGGEILEDVVGDSLIAWLRAHARYGLPVREGTVAPTPSGALALRGVRRIYHAAVVTPVDGTSEYIVNPYAITRATHSVFEVARRERREHDLPLGSMCFPLFGSGRGGSAVARSFDLIWGALMTELCDDSSWSIHFAVRKRHNFDLIKQRLLTKKEDDGAE